MQIAIVIYQCLSQRFSGYWKPKTGTMYPALEKLEKDKLVTSQREFREEGPDRKHYALAKKGHVELSQSVLRWIKMMEMLEHYRETHEAIFRYELMQIKMTYQSF